MRHSSPGDTQDRCPADRNGVERTEDDSLGNATNSLPLPRPPTPLPRAGIPSNGADVASSETHPVATVESPQTPPGHVLYPNVYVWFVFLGAMDIMLTWTILHPVFGGHEVNLLAHSSSNTAANCQGTLLFKFGIVVGIVLICEFVGRRHPARGRWLPEWAVAITSIPVIVALIQIFSRVGVWMRGG